MAEGQNNLVDFNRKYRLSEDAPSLVHRVRKIAKHQVRKCHPKKVLLSTFPFINSLRGYKLTKDFIGDIMAGVTIGIIQIPQGMAYAIIISIPPICGLYTWFFSGLVYFLFGTSRFSSVGCVALISLLIGSALDTRLASMNLQDENVFQPNITMTDGSNLTSNNTAYPEGVQGFSPLDQQKIKIVASLTCLSGIIMMVMSKIRLGFLARLMPDALLNGFTTAVALHIITAQLKFILDMKFPRPTGLFKVIKTWVSVFVNIAHANWATFTTSVISMIILYLVKTQVNARFRHKLKMPIPVELIVIILATGISYGANFHRTYGISIVGTVPAGIPMPTFPDLYLMRDYISDALVIGMLAFVQTFSMAKVYANKHGHKVDNNQEMFASGACSFFNSIFSGFIPAAALTTTSVMEGTGGKSQIASLIASLIVMVVIVGLGPLFASLPKCVLAVISIVNVRLMLLQFSQIPQLWRQSRHDAVIWVGTFAAAFILDADYGVLVGVVISLTTVVLRTQRSIFSELAEVDGTGEFRRKGRYSQMKEVNGLRIVDVNSPLYFANTEAFQQDVYKVAGIDIVQFRQFIKRSKTAYKEPQIVIPDGGKEGESGLNHEKESLLGMPRKVVLNMTGVVFLDSMGILALKTVILDLQSGGIEVSVVGLKDAVIDTLFAAGFPEELMKTMYMSMVPENAMYNKLTHSAMSMDVPTQFSDCDE